jgi:hypothetical protein
MQSASIADLPWHRRTAAGFAPAKVFSFVARRVLSALSGVWNGIKTAGQTAMNLISAAENPGNQTE